VTYDRARYLPTVKRMPDQLWNEIRLILTPEKPDNTIGRPAVSFRKVLDGTFRGEMTGPNRTDRGKLGTKRHVLTDQDGIPLSVKLKFKKELGYTSLISIMLLKI
jgi:hypothetical protein